VDLNRRAFITKGSMTAAAVGLLGASQASVLPAVLGAGGEADAAGADLAGLGDGLDGPVMAHIRDLATGEIGIFTGTREVILHDPAMAARLARAVK
jgi:hypothetical protein